MHDRQEQQKNPKPPAARLLRRNLTMNLRQRLFPVPWQALVLLALPLAAYGPYLTTGFASEDFLILGRFHRGPLGPLLLEQFHSPWLGLSYVSFFRPVATFLLGLEYLAFGTSPFLFHLSHVVLHGINAVLVYGILRRLWKSRLTWPALAAAGLFALYPLHHGAVLFVGGSATLFGAFFFLLSLWLYLGPGSRGTRLGSWLSFVAALGCYEAAVVLPIALVCHQFLTGKLGRSTKQAPSDDPGDPEDPGNHSPREAEAPSQRRWPGWSTWPYWATLVVYFLIRRAVLGVFVGGYTSFHERPLARLGQLGMDFLLSLPRLVFPNFHWLPTSTTLLALAVAGLVTGTALCSLRRGRWVRLWLLALAWAATFQLPFFFVGAIPATGRFWYLASVAACLGLATVASSIAETAAGRWVRLRRGVAAALLGLTGSLFWWLLIGDLETFRQADEQILSIQQALGEVAAKAESPELILLAGVPDFVRNDRGLPVAKVFQYGLSEAVRPPFGKVALEAIPLPPTVAEDRFDALALATGGDVYRWLPRAQALRKESGQRGKTGRPSSARESQTVDSFDATLQSPELIRHGCTECPGLTLLVVTPGATFRAEASPTETSRGEVPLPTQFLASMAGLYDSAAYWWLETRHPDGTLAAVSSVNRLELASMREDLLAWGGSWRTALWRAALKEPPP
ncbi:MAG: hypothetical protein K0U98_22190 [Deltaproteobacteria bacterium]|nr:hypothetical protein [Deltaproteobacteria bacterium]